MYQRIDNQVVSDDVAQSKRGCGPLVAYLMLPEGQLVLGGKIGLSILNGVPSWLS